MSAPTIDFDRLLNREPTAFDETPLRRRIEGARVLVTGAGGSIGSALVERCLDWRAEAVVCVEAHEPSLVRLARRFGDGRLIPALADVRDVERVGRLMRRHDVDACFHLAAYKHVDLAESNVDQVVAVNVLSTLDLADRAAELGVRNFVFPSTDKAVRPPSIYGATKRLCEIELIRRGHGVVRLVNVFGTAGNVVERFASLLLGGARLPVTDESMARYWMTLRESVLLLIAGATLPSGSGPLMIDVGAPVPLVATSHRLAAMLEVPVRGIDVVGWRPGERLVEELTYPHEQLRPTAIRGVLCAESSEPVGDAEALVRQLRLASEDGDVELVRGLLVRAFGSMAPA